jgi:hypothetical protein
MPDHAAIETNARSKEANLAARWRALHDAGQEIGVLAALAPEPYDNDLAAFPSLIESTGGAYLTLARDALADLEAILQPGLTALRTIHSRGQDPTSPALALWREFHAARAALLSLARARTAEEPVIAA